MLTDALEQIAGMHQMLGMLRGVLRQPLSDATGSYADDLLRETITICDRFRAGLESIALEGLDQDDQEGWAALLRVARLMERLEMLQQRHREWTGVAGSVGDAAGSIGALGDEGGASALGESRVNAVVFSAWRGSTRPGRLGETNRPHQLLFHEAVQGRARGQEEQGQEAEEDKHVAESSNTSCRSEHRSFCKGSVRLTKRAQDDGMR